MSDNDKIRNDDAGNGDTASPPPAEPEKPRSDGEPEDAPVAEPVATTTGEESAVSENIGGVQESGAPEGGETVRMVTVMIKGQNRTSHFAAGEHSLKPGDEVVVRTDKGKALGTVAEVPLELACGGCGSRKILRKASPEEIANDAENRVREKEAFDFCAASIEEWDLPMRLVRVEYLLDRSKAIFYFTSEKRVDFRELVRTLAREFSTRIEMRQIGIRDEAKLVGGVGPCGMAFCCTSFLDNFAPISVKMAKEQNVILNPNKISGGCGRLLCCLNYEYDQYREVSRGLPRIGKKVDLPEGSGRVRSIDIFTNTITIDLPDRNTVVMDIEEFREKKK